MIYDLNSTFIPTEGVLKWCREQHISHQLNQHIEGIILLTLSIAALMLSYVLLSFGDRFIENSELNEDHIIMGIKLCHLASLAFMVGYIIYFLMLIK